MIKLDEARAIAATLDDNSPVAVSGRWLRQVIKELAEARDLRGGALDFEPAREGIPRLDLSGPSGSFLALISRDSIPSYGATPA